MSFTISDQNALQEIYDAAVAGDWTPTCQKVLDATSDSNSEVLAAHVGVDRIFVANDRSD